MNNDIIIQTMTESFEVLKDSWETKKESIIKCIVETEACDGALAMDMWGYVLKKNENLLKDKMENIHFIDDIIVSFNNKYESYDIPHLFCRTILYHIAPYMVSNHELLKFIFSNMVNAGYSGANYYYGKTEPLPACLACLFLQDNAKAISIILKSLATNKRMDDIKVGKLLLKTNFYFDEMNKERNQFNCDLFISDAVKDSLLNCLDFIKDRDDRAEIALSLMAR